MFFFIFFTFFTFFLQLNVKRYQVYLVVNKISTLCLKTFKFFQLKPINCTEKQKKFFLILFISIYTKS